MVKVGDMPVNSSRLFTLSVIILLIQVEGNASLGVPSLQDPHDAYSVRVVAKPGADKPTYLIQSGILEIYLKKPKVTIYLASMLQVGSGSYYSAVGRRLAGVDVTLQEGYPPDQVEKLPEFIKLRARRVAASANLLNAEAQPHLLPFMAKERVEIVGLPVEKLSAALDSLGGEQLESLRVRVGELERISGLEAQHPDRISMKKDIGEGIFTSVLGLRKGNAAPPEGQEVALKERGAFLCSKLKEVIDSQRYASIGMIVGAFLHPQIAASVFKEYECSSVVFWLDVITS